MAEHLEQQAVVEWYRWQYPKLQNYLFAIPNGAALCDISGKKRNARLKYLFDEGFRSGVSDLFLALPAAQYHGLWLEMKDNHKKIESLSLNQTEFILDMRAAGFAAAWAAGSAQAIAALQKYMALRNCGGKALRELTITNRKSDYDQISNSSD